jgi:hypothetical protein
MADTLMQASNTATFEIIPDDILEKALKTPPFIPLPGTLNLRTLEYPGLIIPNIVFRSGNLAWWPTSSIEQLYMQYGVVTIFDIRRERETQTEPSPTPDAVEVVWRPLVQQPLPVNLNEFASEESPQAFAKMYMDILAVFATTIKLLFEHLRDRPGVPILFHCNGKYSGLCSGCVTCGTELIILRASWQRQNRCRSGTDSVPGWCSSGRNSYGLYIDKNWSRILSREIDTES